MEPLYLMRRKRFELHGPFRKSELKGFLSKQAPLSDWELCGSMGEWVCLANQDDLKAAYIELWKELNVQPFSWKSLFSLKK